MAHSWATLVRLICVGVVFPHYRASCQRMGSSVHEGPSILPFLQSICGWKWYNQGYPKMMRGSPRFVMKNIWTLSFSPCLTRSLTCCSMTPALFSIPSTLYTFRGHGRSVVWTLRALASRQSIKFSVAPLSMRAFFSAVLCEDSKHIGTLIEFRVIKYTRSLMARTQAEWGKPFKNPFLLQRAYRSALAFLHRSDVRLS
jgi:hypothetical protein